MHESILINHEEFRDILRCLPDDWRELARSTGAMQRCRQVSSAETLIRLLLMHASGLSLRQTVTRARIHHIADMSDVALMKKVNKSAAWICAINSSLIAEARQTSLHASCQIVESHSLMELIPVNQMDHIGDFIINSPLSLSAVPSILLRNQIKQSRSLTFQSIQAICSWGTGLIATRTGSDMSSLVALMSWCACTSRHSHFGMKVANASRCSRGSG